MQAPSAPKGPATLAAQHDPVWLRDFVRLSAADSHGRSGCPSTADDSHMAERETHRVLVLLLHWDQGSAWRGPGFAPRQLTAKVTELAQLGTGWRQMGFNPFHTGLAQRLS